MSFYVREGVRVGPVRFNLSKTGVGVSLGVKGFRFGTGPKGEYVHVGKGPVRYRKYKQLGSTGEASSTFDGSTSSSHGSSETEAVEKDPEDVGTLEDPANADASSLVETGPEDVIEEINAARSRWRSWPLAATVSTALLFFSLIAAVVGAVVTVLLYQRDQVRKTVALFYDFEEEAEEQYKNVCQIFAGSAESGEIWNAEVGFGSPDSVKTNVPIPTFSTGKQSLYFFPERILLESSEGVGILPYQDIQVSTSSTTREREAGQVPIDAEVVGSRWKHRNKDGSRDKRYKDNPKIKEFKMEQVHLRSTSESPHSVRAKIGFSKTGVAAAVSKAVRFLPVRLEEQAAENKSGEKKPQDLNLGTLLSEFKNDFSREQRKKFVQHYEEKNPRAAQMLRIFAKELSESEQDQFIERCKEVDPTGEEGAAMLEELVSGSGASGEAKPQGKSSSVSENEDALSSSPEPYETADLDASRLGADLEGPLHEAPTRTLADLIEQVVDKESPVHKEIAARRVAEAAGVERLGRRIQAAFDEAIKLAEREGAIEKKDCVLRDPDQKQVPVRDRNGLEGRDRDIEYVPESEIAEAIRQAWAHFSNPSREEIIRQASRRLGFERVGSTIQERVGSIFDSIQEEGTLAERSRKNDKQSGSTAFRSPDSVEHAPEEESILEKDEVTWSSDFEENLYRFAYEFDDQQRQNVVDKLREKDSNAAEILEFFDTFIHELNDKQKRRQIDELRETSPRVAEAFRRTWKKDFSRESAAKGTGRADVSGENESGDAKSSGSSLEVEMTSRLSSSDGSTNGIANLQDMSKGEAMDKLVEQFLDLNNRERKKVLDKLEEKNPNAAKILQNVWDMERSGERSKELVDDILDALS